MKRLVKVFRVRYEHAATKVSAEYVVIARSEIKALEEVLRLRHGFTRWDAARQFCARHGCTVTAEPWTGEVPTIATLVDLARAP